MWQKIGDNSRHRDKFVPVEEVHERTLFLQHSLIVTLLWAVSVYGTDGRGLDELREVFEVVKIDDGAGVGRHHKVSGNVIVAE